MQRLDVSSAVRPIYGSLGVKRLRPLLALHPPLSPLTHHRDNVTAPHGRPNLRSRLHSCHAQEGGQRSPQRTCGGIGKKKVDALCGLAISYRHFGRTCCLRLQGLAFQEPLP